MMTRHIARFPPDIDVRTPLRVLMALVGLTGILGYTLFYYGGVHTPEWVFAVLVLGVLALGFWAKTISHESALPLDGKLRWLVLLIPGYAFLQCVPLPQVLVAMIFPARLQVSASVSNAVASPGFTTLSVAPTETLAHAFRLLVYVAVFLLARELADRKEHWAWLIVLPVILLATIEASIGLLQFGLGEADEVARGTYVNRNHFAGLLEMALPFAVMYPVAVLRRQRPPGSSSLKPTLKACAALSIAAVLFLGIVYSLSRMGFVASLCSLLVMSVVAVIARVESRKRLLFWALLGLLAASSFVFLPPDQLIYRFAAVSSTEAITAEGRIGLWQETLSLVADYPVFGCGLGGYGSAFQKYKFSGPMVSDPYAHNDYLQLLAETGVVGVSLIGGLLLLVFWRTAKLATDYRVPHARFLALACFGAMTALLIHSLVDFNLYIPANIMVLAWIMGIAAALPRSVEWQNQTLPIQLPQIIDIEAQAVE